jgi:hypothetical protein
MCNPIPILCALLLLATANGTPVFATKLLGHKFDAPLDGGIRLPDRQRLFGESKTGRGFAVSIASTMLVAILLGLDWSTGVAFAAASLAGDLTSSFIKRRLGLTAHARARGLDQIPEATLPLLVLRSRLGLSLADIAVTVAAFVVLQLALSRLLFTLHIRDRPY